MRGSFVAYPNNRQVANLPMEHLLELVVLGDHSLILERWCAGQNIWVTLTDTVHFAIYSTVGTVFLNFCE